MANNQQIDETQLQSILAEVEAELGKLAKSDLSKARPGESTESEDSSDASSTDPTGDNTSAASESPDAASASPDAAGGDGPPPADASASPPADDGSAPPADDGSAAGADPSADPAGDQGPIDPQALMAEYSKLSPEDQKLHYMCLKQVLMQTLAGAGADPGAGDPAAAGAGAPPPGADASAGAPPPPPAAGPSAGAPPPGPDASAGAPPPPTLKAETGMSNDPKANGDLSKVTGGGSLSKSEFDAAVEAAVAPLFKVVKHVLEAPLRKSVKSIADLPGATTPTVDVSKMTREQMRSKLSEKLKAGTLSKSEKDLMIGFDTGKVKADQIAHLLK